MAVLRRLDAGRIAILAVLLVGAAAFITRDQWDWFFEDASVQTEGVDAATLDDVDLETEQLYRIGAGSSASYTVEERLGGASSAASGSTEQVGGDIAVNTGNPAESRVGEIVVNVESLTSDSSLRDKRIRLDFLESRKFPFAVFEPSAIEGIPADAAEETDYVISITGDLSVKETTSEMTFSGTVRYDNNELVADVSAIILLSTFDVGPINISGLVHTSDEAVLDLHLVAQRVEVDSAPTAVGEFAAPPLNIGAGDFSATVQPILEANCASCHTNGGPGWSTIAIETAGDAAEIAADIDLVTRSRYMPPWPAGDLSLPFRHDWSLNDSDLATLASWAANGGGIDVDAGTPLVPVTGQLVEIEEDWISRTQPYSGSTDVLNDYRCRAIEVGDPETERWIQALEFAPDNLSVSHHGLLFTSPASSREQIARVGSRDEEEGWSCFGLAGISGSNLVAGWAPGMQPFELPVGSGLRLAPGDLMILQIHYHYEDVTPPDAPSVVFDFVDDSVIEAAGGAVSPLQYQIYLGGAEIPCTPEEEATGAPLCDRDAVLSEIRENFGDFAAGIPIGLMSGCGQRLEDFLDDTDGVVTSTCDHRITNPGQVVSLWGHMHEFGSSYRMTLNPGTSEERVLLDIPTWSFEWQFGYVPENVFVVDDDDVIRVECTWDRSLSHQPEPRYITWNEGTEDEMCWTSFATIAVRSAAG
jgi:polyisoprenoid-binding protein YceI